MIDIARYAGIDAYAGRRRHGKIRIRQGDNGYEPTLCPGIEGGRRDAEGCCEQVVAIAGRNMRLPDLRRAQRRKSGVVNGKVFPRLIHIAENFYGQRYCTGGSRRQAGKEEGLVFGQHFI